MLTDISQHTDLMDVCSSLTADLHLSDLDRFVPRADLINTKVRSSRGQSMVGY
ncbi:hypothetical protein YL84_003684 [Salmonella enterica subsp. enterica]|nr:hypothetical protein [Salmonella enterica subsp. enterica]EEC0711708.1 hypothetical protein [Salmonella enterica subsp. enterica]